MGFIMRKYHHTDGASFNQEDFLSEGKRPLETAPYTLKDKIKAILKSRTQFDEKECQILNTFCSSDEDREYTLDMYDISKDKLYRLLQRVNILFSQICDKSKNR